MNAKDEEEAGASFSGVEAELATAFSISATHAPAVVATTREATRLEELGVDGDSTLCRRLLELSKALRRVSGLVTGVVTVRNPYAAVHGWRGRLQQSGRRAVDIARHDVGRSPVRSRLWEAELWCRQRHPRLQRLWRGLILP